jgi:hypothetical protein
MLVSCLYGPDWLLPPLLRNLESRGGWADACPLSPELAATLGRNLNLADTPEFDLRLSREFPNGSSNAHLVATLEQMGFRSIGNCDTDPSIHVERYDQEPLVLGLYPLTATVYWKTDPKKKVLWTRGFIFYTGP